MNRFLLLLTIIVTSLNSCKKDSNPISNAPNDQTIELLPLKIGNNWTMQRTLYSPPGTFWLVDAMTFIVRSDTVLDNQTWYLTTEGALRNGTDGLYAYNLGPLLVFKYPSIPNDTFSIQGNTITVISTNEPKKVGPNLLLCYHYSESILSSNDILLQYYFAPGIGWVHLEEAVGGGTPTENCELTATYDLIDYHLK